MTFDERSWLGDFEAPARKARVPQSEAALSAKAQGARPFPASCVKVLQLTGGEDFDADAVVEVLESDPPLAVRILALVNSSSFALRTRCTSIRQATSLLGSRGIRSAVVAASALNAFPGSGSPEWKKLHDHAHRVAALARHLAPEWRLPADEMFTTAFLHDIGKWILLETEPAYAKIVEEHGHVAEGTLEPERALFGFDHAELSEFMLATWNIPAPIPRVVGTHHDPAAAYGGNAKFAVRVAVLRLANLLAHAMTSKASPDFDALASTEPLTYLELSAQSLRERYDALRDLEHDHAHDDASSDKPATPPGEPKADASATTDAAASKKPSKEREEICSYCDAASFGDQCPRCRARLCGAHAAEPGKLCRPCEEAFRVRVDHTPLARPLVSLGIAGAGLALSVGAAQLFGPTWMAGVPAEAAVAVAIFGMWTRWHLRQTFVDERPAPPRRGAA